MQKAQQSDGADRGKLAIQVAGHGDVEPTLYLTRQGSRTSTERHVFHKDHKLEIAVAPGTYLGHVTAAGTLPGSFAVTIAADKTMHQTVQLKKGSHKVATFEARLRAYGFTPKDAVDKIELKPREHRVTKPGRDGTNVTRLQSLAQLRQFLGGPAGHFGHDVPRFDPVAVPKGLPDRLLERKLTEGDKVALAAIMDEHLNGNERAYTDVLGKYADLISAYVDASAIYTLANNLTIAPGATYTFSGSLVLDTLHISTTGNLNPTGVFKVDVTNWIEF